MTDKAKMVALAENVNELLILRRKQNETTRQLLRVCLKHLKDRRSLIPTEVWKERQELIAALEEFTKDKQEGNYD